MSIVHGFDQFIHKIPIKKNSKVKGESTNLVQKLNVIPDIKVVELGPHAAVDATVPWDVLSDNCG